MGKYFDLPFLIIGLSAVVVTGVVVLWLGWPGIVLGGLSVLMASRRRPE